MSLPPGFIDELRDRVSLADVVGRKVTWDMRKSNQAKGDWWAPCPFHQEKTASFHVDDRKGFYYCFGCHAKGDAIGFVTEIENVGFMEAVEILAREAGMAMPARDPAQAERDAARAKLSDVMELAVQFYRLQLRTGRAQAARDYLAGRGLDDKALGRFEIGFAPDDRTALLKHLEEKGVETRLIVESGMAIAPDDGGKPYDRFRGRIMFPIRNARGRCIAFGGRAMDPNARAKYLNSPETSLFDKGRSLYNIGPAREAAGKAGALIVAEGYMDVIALAEAGFGHSVAPLGTAITEDQLKMLWRVADEPLIALDGDAAGQRAAMRLVDLALPLLAPGKSLRFCMMPAGRDPDDLIRNAGAAAMQKALDASSPMVELLWRRETEGKVFDSPERRAALDKALREALGRIHDPSIRDHYRAAIKERRAELFRPAAQAGRESGGGRFGGAFGGGRRPWTPGGGRRGFAPAPGPASAEAKRSALGGAAADEVAARIREAALIQGMLNHPEIAERHEDALHDARFLNADLGRIRDAVLSALPAALHGDATGEASGDDRRRLLKQAATERLGADPAPALEVAKAAAALKSLAPGADAEVAEQALTELLDRHRAIVAASDETRDAEREMAGDAGEDLTWRLAAAAEALENAGKSQGGRDRADLSEKDEELSSRLKGFIDDQIWIKRKRRNDPQRR
jgi:DNA primase